MKNLNETDGTDKLRKNTVRTLCFVLFFVFFNICPNVLFPQQIENSLSGTSPFIYKKLYLHTDRELYFASDTIWFKAYYVDGQTHQFTGGLYSMYTELIDADGKVILSQVWPVEKGTSIGQLALPDSLVAGDYLLRAYTDIQKKFGVDAFYYKKLKISKIEKGPGIKKLEPVNDLLEIDISFLPEGGLLLAGQENVVGCKAISKNGHGISVHGRILDSKEKIVGSFETSYRGMGSIHFTPESGEVYSVRVDGHPDVRFDFCEVVEDGIKIEFLNEDKDMLSFQVITNSNVSDKKKYHFAIMNKGKEIFHQRFTLKEHTFPIRVFQSALPAGINRFILLDTQIKPLSERLYFSRNFNVNEVSIRFDQDSFPIRSKVHCEILDDERSSKEEWSNLSVSVISMDAIEENPSINILSWLLIDSELKGYIGSSSDYFIDDESLSSVDKLNFLMLTHGWSRYIWNTIPELDPGQELIEFEGIPITGKVERVIGKKPVADGDVIMNIYKNDYFLHDSIKTDENGRFAFDNIYFTDSASIFLQAKNQKGKLLTEIFLDPPFKNYEGVSAEYLPAHEEIFDFPVDLYKQQYHNEKAMTDFLIEAGVIVLDEVTVIGYKPKVEKNDGHFRLYGNPDASLTITEKDLGFINVFDYLQGRMAGLTISGNSARIHGFSSFGTSSLAGANSVLFLLDGVPVESEMLAGVPMSFIDKVEVLKFSNAAIYGSRGGNGVIAVYTKKELEFFDPIIPGTVSEKIDGYSSHREFYSPKYSPENIPSEKPDNRITLYWEPEIVTQNGKASLSFFTSDDITRFKVLVEGITRNGKICIGISEFEVTRMSSNLLEY